MKMMMRIAWRNIFRNKRRTLLSGLAVGIGLASMIFVFAVFDGMLKSMIRTATDSFMGQGQIHAEGFTDTQEAELIIKDFENVIASLDKEPLIEAYTPRTVSLGMLSSPSDVTTAVVYGIDPALEPALSMIDEALTMGAYIGADDMRGVLIGLKAAQTLDVEVGDRVVLTMAQATTGELSQEMFRIRGIFNFNIREVDSSVMYVHIDKARAMLGIGSAAHEIALKLSSLDLASDQTLPFWSEYSTGGNVAEGWRDLLPQLDSVMGMSDINAAIMGILVFCIVALTIINTLFMSLYERMFEFGVLRAIGTRPTKIAMMIVFEAISLGVISAFIGGLIGLGFTYYFSKFGIDYRGIEFASVTITDLLYPTIIARHYIELPLLVIAFAALASIYPAVFAARLSPAKTLRRSM